jgi:hypothetical protein
MMPNMPLTQDDPSILLHRVEPGVELMEVASGIVMPSRDINKLELKKM